MPTLPTHYGNLYYAEHQKGAAGTPVILLHGAGASHLIWDAPLRRLVARRVLAPDLPAHGRSTGDPLSRIEDMAAALLAFMDALPLEKVILLGHSMGGAIAQQMALMAPARVEKLILLGTGAQLYVNPMILNDMRQDQAKIAALLNQWSWSKNANSQLVAKDLHALNSIAVDVLYADYSACSHFDVRGALPHLHIPALVVTGSQDKMTPPALGKTLAALLPQASFQILEGAGHNLMLEQASQLAEMITQWINTPLAK